MATYEGKWRCDRCRTINRGRDLNCGSCGVKRGEDTEFYLDQADMPPVEDEVLLARANAGADWICRYCAGGNSALLRKCTSCGNPRSSGDVTLREETRGDYSDWAENAGREKTTSDRKFSDVAAPENLPVDTSLSFNDRLKSFALRFGMIGAVASLVAVCALLVYLSSLRYPVEVEVAGLEWTRSIALEEFRTVSDSGWENELPSDARVTSQSRQLHHTDRVASGSHTEPETYTERVSDGTERYKCGTINKKNGFFEDKYCTRTKYKTVTKTRTRTVTEYANVPVYRTRYNYQVDRWMPAGSRDTSGNNFNPQWAIVVVDNRRVRESGRTENYNLVCKELGGNNKLYKISVGNRWDNFSQGQRLHGQTNYFGSLVSVEELPGNEW